MPIARATLTFRDLKTSIAKLDDKQLDAPVLLLREGPVIHVHELLVFAEDQINPSGDGLEDASAYDDDPDFDMSDEQVIFVKNTPVLTNND